MSVDADYHSNPFAYIRRYYGVPAEKGRRVRFHYYDKEGVITGHSTGAHILVRFDGDEQSQPCHPTWKMQYLDVVEPSE